MFIFSTSKVSVRDSIYSGKINVAINDDAINLNPNHWIKSEKVLNWTVYEIPVQVGRDSGHAS